MPVLPVASQLPLALGIRATAGSEVDQPVAAPADVVALRLRCLLGRHGCRASVLFRPRPDALDVGLP